MVKPLTDEEKKSLADSALLSAISKARQMSVVHGHLHAAIESLLSYERCWNNYAQDPQLIKLREEIDNICRKYGSGWDRFYDIAFSLTDLTQENIEYDDGKYETELRYREEGIEYDEYKDDFPPDLTFVDPWEMYNRMRAE